MTAVTTPSPIVVQYTSHIDNKHVKLNEKILSGLFEQLRQRYMNEGIEKQKVVHVEGKKSRLQLSACIQHGCEVIFELQRIVQNDIAKKPIVRSEDVMHIAISLISRRCKEAWVIDGKYRISTMEGGPVYDNGWESVNDIPDTIFYPCVEISKLYDEEVKKNFDPGITPTQLFQDIFGKREIFANHRYGDIVVRIKRSYDRRTTISVKRISTDQMLLKVRISNDILESAEKYAEAMEMAEARRRMQITDNLPYHHRYEAPGMIYYEVFDDTKTWVKEMNSAIHLYMRMGCLILENTALW